MIKQMGLLALCCIGCAMIFDDGSPVQPRRVSAGRWGGQHINIEVSANTAEIEYDCAHGTIEGPLEINGKGRFRLKGTHTPEHGGPVRRDESANTRPALYTGSIHGETMTLTVTLTDKNETVGTYTLTKGATGRIFKCM
jgi:hypothetical protein